MSRPNREYNNEPGEYLQAGSFIDSDNSRVIEFANRHRVAGETDIEAAIRLYLAVRDQVSYNPYLVGTDPRYFRASDCLASGSGFCIPKAALLAACARVIGIPARVGYADVRNHLSSKRLDEMIGGNVYTWHSYTDLFLDGKWVKATPAFDRALCERVGVPVLAFDGKNDSLLQRFNAAGERHMEYVSQRGVFADVPFAKIIDAFEANHPRWLHNQNDLDDEVFDSRTESSKELV